MKNIYTALLLVSSLLVSLSSQALPFSNSNILVSSDNMLFEYTPEGQIVQQIPIPINLQEAEPHARDLIVTASGEVAIFNGTTDPELSLYDPQTEQWRSFKYPGWDVPVNNTFSGVAAYGDGIYVNDMLGGGQGIIRFGLDGAAQRFLDGNEYLDLTLGLDNKFYALVGSNRSIDVIDPVSMQKIRNINLDFSTDVRGIAVNASGEIYTVSWNGEISKYDNNGVQINGMPSGTINLYDIDINSQGHIIYQDRNDNVYLTNEQFIPPQIINLPVPVSALTYVAFAINDAIAPNPASNVLVSSDNMLFEYTLEGQLVQQIQIPLNSLETSSQSRDLIVTSSGEIAIFNGTFDPELSLYDRKTLTWRSFKFPGWSIANNISYGGIATYGDGIYVTDMLADGSGIVRFGFDGIAQRYIEGTEYTDLTLGLDGYFYAIQAYYGKIDVIRPADMQVVRSIVIEPTVDVRGIAVNAVGEIYAVSWNDGLIKYDTNGLRLSTSPILLSYMSDIDIDAQGRIILQDRSNFVYITNEQFEQPKEFILPVSPNALSFVAFSKNDAIAKTNPNILVSSDNRMFEYTPDGQLVSELPIPPIPEPLAQARDLIVTKTGEIAFFNGTFDPELSLYNPQTSQWRSFQFPGWDISNNISYGGIAAYSDFIYVTDMLGGGSGIVRFLVDGTSQDGFAERFMNGQEYIDLTVGLDRNLYALNKYGDIDVIDPISMQFIRNVYLDLSVDIRALAVNQIGEIFSVNWNGELNKYNANGMLINSLPIAWNISDIDINASGKIILQDRYNNVFITDETGLNPTVFPLPVPSSAMSFVAFANNDVFGSKTTTPIDSDNDGMPDDWELQYALDPQDPNDAQIDFEGDGLTNLQEFLKGTDPWNPDSDSDGLFDGDEVNMYGTNPTNRDSDSDGMSDGYEINNQLDPRSATDALLDKDGDGLTNLQEYQLGTSASVLDSDGDGINDGDEFNQGLNPTDRDTDNDGIDDGKELLLGLNPLQRDSNSNGVIDGFEHGNVIRISSQLENSSQSYGQNSGASLSSDGRYVVFVSENSNLVSNDTNGVMDVFWSDTLTGEVRRVSVSSTGEEGNDWSGRIVNGFGIDISDDGRFVVFHSSASNLVANDTNSTDIFVHDTQTSTTSRVSVTSTGLQANGSSWYPSISGDGRYVVFDSNATNLLPGIDGNASFYNDVFVHDRQTGVTTLVSKNSEGVQGNSRSTNAVISGNGRFVAFRSYANNLVANDTNGTVSDYYGIDVFVHDLLTGITERVSISTDGVEGDHFSEAASISADGRFVAFHSLATTLDINVPASYNVFVHDRMLGQTKRIAIDQFEGATYNFRMFPEISSSGRYIALRAFKSNGNVIFVYDQITGETRLASRNNNGLETQSTIGNNLAISDDGQYVGFSTSQWQLVPDKTGGLEDVFVAKSGFKAELASAPFAAITSVDSEFIFTPIIFDASLSSDPNGDPLIYQWDFGDGSFASGINVSHEYTTSGNYTVILSVIDGSNPPSVVTKVITVLSGAPSAVITSVDSDFIFTPITFDASLSSDPNGQPLIYQWDFGDGSFAAGPLVSHEYSASGSYTVTLSVIDGSNPPAVATKVVNIDAGAPSAVINTVVDNGFIFTPITFDASLSSDPNGQPLLYQWDFGDGSFAAGTLVSHEYMTSGSYTVTLSVIDGSNPPAIATKIINIDAGAPSAVISSLDSEFIFTPITFNASQSSDPNGQPLLYQWDFGDGNFASGVDVNHEYAIAGNYTVTLSVLDGSNPPVIATKVVSIDAGAPSAVITSIDNDFIFTPITFDASLSSDPNNQPLIYQWDFGDGNFSSGINVNHEYITSGNYTVTLSVLDGSNPPVIATKIVNIDAGAPSAVISSTDAVNKNELITFDASLSVDPNGQPLIYQWDLGDGTFASGVNVSHVYPASGSYTVTLSILDGSNPPTIATKVIAVVNQAPTAVITSVDTIDKNVSMSFDASLSSDSNGDPLTYSWDFGDGVTATGAMVNHTYSTTGMGAALVTLTASDGESSTSIRKYITIINHAPTPIITAPDTLDKNVTAIFDASLSTDIDGDILTYHWNFGDGGLTASTPIVNRAYTTSGIYTVTLTISDGATSASISKLVTVVNQAPTAVISAPDTVNRNESVIFDASLSTDLNSDALSYSWDFGDGITTTGISYSHTYTSSGSYTVTLIVSDGDASTTMNKVITVLNEAPVVVMTGPDSIKKDNVFTLDATTSSDPNGDVLTYTWDFGDGSSVTDTSAWAAHYYSMYGSYTVTLTVSDGELTTIVSKVITVINPAPIPVITAADTVNKNANINFSAALSTDPLGDVLTHNWDFGDGSIASGVNVDHVYVTSGSYTVTLTTSDGETSISTSKLITVVNQAPTATISSADTVNKKESILFDSSLSTDPNGDVLSYSWNFGDGSLIQVSTNTSVNHVYSTSGTYTITLTVSDGETSTVTNKVITVLNQGPSAIITAADTVNKNAITLYDASLSTDPNGDVLSYSWNFGDGVTATGVNVNHAYVTSGSYTVQLTINDGESSVVTSKVITVTNQAPVANAGADQVVDEKTTVTLDGSASFDPDAGDSISYSWTQISGREVTLEDTNNAIATFKAPRVRRGRQKEMVFELTVTDEEGVSSSDTVLIIAIDD